MKKLHFLVILTLLIIAEAEPPRFRFKKSRKTFQRQQLESTSTTESSTDLTTNQPENAPYPLPMAPYPAAGYRPGRAFNLPTDSRNSTDNLTTTAAPGGPYPPSGWKPKGRKLELPTEEQTQPPVTYLPPPMSEYGPPSKTYGTPQDPQTESPNELDEDDVDDDAVAIDAEIDEMGPSKSQEGFYFITLPDGTLQKVTFSTSAGGNIFVKAQTVGRQIETPVAVENQSKPRIVSFVQQYQSW